MEALPYISPIMFGSVRSTLCYWPSSCSTTTTTAFRAFCVSAPNLEAELIPVKSAAVVKKPSTATRNGLKPSAKAAAAQLKESWLASLSCPLPEHNCIHQHAATAEAAATIEERNEDTTPGTSASSLVIGIDPDVSGALAVLTTDSSGCSAEVFDSPFVKVSVGSKVRKRLDAHSIVKLLRSFDAPFGTTAYIEQSIPYPQDGKQGWWAGGFGYGLWIGVLVASGFSVIPVPSALWKNEFELTGDRMSKDDSRKLAVNLFPSLSAHLARKKDHGRAEALLIAAYGSGIRVKSKARNPEECCTPLVLLDPANTHRPHTTQHSLEDEDIKLLS